MLFPQLLFTILCFHLMGITGNPALDPIPSPEPDPEPVPDYPSSPEEPDPEPVPTPEPDSTLR